ncbi:MAG: hypothetical protein ABR936_14760 [Bacteroidota bacterium]|jgi:hypothetical protein
MSEVVSDSERERIRNKSDAELEIIIDATHHTADSALRKTVFEEKHRRLKEQNSRNESIQRDIRRMTKTILWLTAISIIAVLIFGVLALIKKP